MSVSKKTLYGFSFLLSQSLISSLLAVTFYGIAARFLPTVSDFGIMTSLIMIGGLFSVIFSFAMALSKYHQLNKEQMLELISSHPG